MMQVQILSRVGNQYNTTDGLKTPIGNAEHRNGSLAWCDGDYIFGNQQASSRMPYVPIDGDGIFNIVQSGDGYSASFNIWSGTTLSSDKNPIAISSNLKGHLYTLIDGNDIAIIYWNEGKIYLSFSWVNNIEVIDLSSTYLNAKILLKIGDLKNKICKFDVIGDNKDSNDPKKYIFSNSYENSSCVRVNRFDIPDYTEAKNKIKEDVYDIYKEEQLFKPITVPGSTTIERYAYVLGDGQSIRADKTYAETWNTTMIDFDKNVEEVQYSYALNFNNDGFINFLAGVKLMYRSLCSTFITSDRPENIDQTHARSICVTRQYFISDPLSTTFILHSDFIDAIGEKPIQYYDTYDLLVQDIHTKVTGYYGIRNPSTYYFWNQSTLTDVGPLYFMWADNRDRPQTIYLSVRNTSTTTHEEKMIEGKRNDYSTTVNTSADCLKLQIETPLSWGTERTTFPPSVVTWTDTHDAGNGYFVKSEFNYPTYISTLFEGDNKICGIPIVPLVQIPDVDNWRWYVVKIGKRDYLASAHDSKLYEISKADSKLIEITGFVESCIKIQHSTTKKNKAFAIKQKISDLIIRMVKGGAT